MKVLGLDCETTGLVPSRNTIVQLAGYVEIDYEVVERFNLYCKPVAAVVDDTALKLIRKTREQIDAYPHPDEARAKFTNMLGKYVDKFNKADKFTVVGFNAKFDLDFVGEWLKKGGDPYFFSWVSPCTIDPMHLSSVLQYLGVQDYSGLPNRKLGTLCKHHGVDLDENAHDAKYDIEATRLLARKQLDLLEGIQ